MKKKYQNIIKHYESCLQKHGDTHLGVDWPNADDVDKRYKVMIDIVKDNDDTLDNITILDFGCGTAHLLEYIIKNKFTNIEYKGLDISQQFIEVAKKKFPKNTFYCEDILSSNFILPQFDYILMNGVFTEKHDLSFDEMWSYFTEVLSAVFHKCNKGIAFNVMSKIVDWEREDLFHVSQDLLTEFLCNKLSRSYIIKNNYGLYEYTVYIYK